MGTNCSTVIALWICGGNVFVLVDHFDSQLLKILNGSFWHFVSLTLVIGFFSLEFHQASSDSCGLE